MLHFKEPAPLFGILGKEIDNYLKIGTRNSNVVGLYLCRTSTLWYIEQNAFTLLRDLRLFSPVTPIQHTLADRSLIVSQLFGSKTLYSIQQYAGKTGKIPNVVMQSIQSVR